MECFLPCSRFIRVSFDQSAGYKIFSANQISENRYCRKPGAALVDAETYLCLLENSRKHQELIKIYHGKGERSVQEAANLVGLKLPELYKEDE